MPKRDPLLLARARAMRTNATPAEAAMWRLLRAHQFAGTKFSRQVQVGGYIVDFAARSRNLAIEVDGQTHATRGEYDAARTLHLEELGYHVLRFTNAEVLTNPDGVAHAIGVALAITGPSPNPLPEGERA